MRMIILVIRMRMKRAKICSYIADGGNDDDLSCDYDDGDDDGGDDDDNDDDDGICCSQVQQLEAGKVKLEADLNQVGAVLVNLFDIVLVLESKESGLIFFDNHLLSTWSLFLSLSLSTYLSLALSSFWK